LSIGVGKFRDALAAGAAGRTEHGLVHVGQSANNGNPQDPLAAGNSHCADRTRFGAGTHGEGCIFDIAAHMHGARFILDGGSDPKIGIPRVGALPRRKRPVEQLVFRYRHVSARAR
jgi:hypothetical protein